MWNNFAKGSELPKDNSLIICLFSDGSGANIFFYNDEDNIEDIDAHYYCTSEDLQENYFEWAYLPNSFKPWGWQEDY